MENIKVEKFNGYDIRFLEENEKWFAIASDVSIPLGYDTTAHMLRIVRPEYKRSCKVDLANIHNVDVTRHKGISSSKRKIKVLAEKGIFEAAFHSRKKQARKFQDWVYDTLVTLRKKAQLKEYETFRLVEDTNVQKGLMVQLDDGLNGLTPRQAIKANTIANKATSNVFGFSKMVKKDEMTDEMKLKRQDVLKDVVELMTTQKKFGLDDLSISKTVYTKYQKASA